MPHSCALLGGFAIGARVWQHNANAKCQRVHACTRCLPSFKRLLQRADLSGFISCINVDSYYVCMS